jgi:hypothetical protein
MSDDIHFEVKDYAGRTIVCTVIQWEDHVLKPSHKYMEGAENEVISALKSPDNNIRYIDRNPKYTNRRIYYKAIFDYFVKVVVDYQDDKCDGIGYVWTAFMPSEITKGEKPEI